MAEAVASQLQFRAPSFAAPGSCNETLRQQVEDFEVLIETMLEQYEATRRENEALRRENEALKDENARLKGE